MTTTAPAVSAAVRRTTGARPTSDRWYEGIRVSNSVHPGTVRVYAAWNSPRVAREQSQAVEEALTGLGYTVERTSPTTLLVTKD